MERRNLTEGKAFRRMQPQSQNENKKLSEIAQAIIVADRMLSKSDRKGPNSLSQKRERNQSRVSANRGAAPPAPRGRVRSRPPVAKDPSRRWVTLLILGGAVLFALGVLVFQMEGGTKAPRAESQTGANIPALQEQLRQNPADVSAMISLGNAFYDTNRFVDAIPWYEKALLSVPNNTDVRTDLGIAYLYSNNAEKAKENWLRVLEMEPNKIQTRYNMGVLYSQSSPPDMDKAAQEWEAVVRIAPDSEQGKLALERLKALGRR
ncbi:MAG TPA: tetratricopeptide repeat protein [Chloroflexota bacterium]|nr:tetratricopeptide repeat protein [Chloroflexota bacterium]